MSLKNKVALLSKVQKVLRHLSPLSFALLYIPFVSFILNYLFYRPPCLYFLILEFFFSISGISSTHHICPITFYLSISTQFLGETFLLPHLPDSFLTYWAELGIPSTGSHQALIIPPMLHCNSLFLYVLIDHKLSKGMDSSLFIFVHSCT